MIAIWQNGNIMFSYYTIIVLKSTQNTMITNETRVIDLSVDQFRQLIREENSAINLPEKSTLPKILKRKDVAKLYSVSLVTLTKWVKAGKIIQHSIGSRRYFIESEVHEALQSNIKKRGGTDAKK